MRCWSDLAWLAAASALLVVSALPVSADQISSVERAAFRVVNDPTVLPFVIVWPVMQLGNILVLAVAALVALVARRLRLAVSIVVGGLAAYVIAKVVKRIVERGRPDKLLSDVTIRGEPSLGLGYVSGHAAVIALLAMVTVPYLPKRWRWVPWVVLLVVGWARIYVGAHLPLDVVGGAALGLAVGAAMRLLFGRPGACPQLRKRPLVGTGN
ncbi:MAG: phosphatase PAP2 family protein [Actinomycetes bacterium]